MFGSSIASYRREGKKSYVKSVFHGAYRRKVFEDVGGFNEALGRTEDNELHYRIRRKGYKICFHPGIHSRQHVRSSLKEMVRQKYSNGYWIGRLSEMPVPVSFCSVWVRLCHHRQRDSGPQKA